MSFIPWTGSNFPYRSNATLMSAVGPGSWRQKMSGTETRNPSRAHASASSRISWSTPKMAVISRIPGAFALPSGPVR